LVAQRAGVRAQLFDDSHSCSLFRGQHDLPRLMRILQLVATLSLVVGAAAFAQAPAQGYPSKAIRVIVPFGPGTGTDILARILTEDLRAAHGWSFVVD